MVVLVVRLIVVNDSPGAFSRVLMVLDCCMPCLIYSPIVWISYSENPFDTSPMFQIVVVASVDSW